MRTAAIGVAVVWAVLVAAGAQAATAKGVVYGPDGAPVAGAKVWASPFELRPWTKIEALTDPQGRFTFTLTNGRWTVRARQGALGGEANDQYGRVRVSGDRDPAPMTIRLTERGILQGRLLDAQTGKPIPNGRIYLDTGELVTADADGRYETGGLTQSDHHLITLCPGYDRRRILFDTTLRPSAQLDIRLPVAGKIVGQVLDLQGQPLAGAKVGRPTSGNVVSLAALYESCDTQGRFTWDGAAFDQPLRLQAEAPGYEEVMRRGFIITPTSQPAVLEFRLAASAGKRGARADSPKKAAAQTAPAQSAPLVVDEPRRTIRGVVRLPDGKPVSDARVRWGATDYEGTNRRTRSDAQGRFELPEVPDHKGYVTVVAPPFAPSFTAVDGGDREVEVQLQEGVSIRGVVQDNAGAPLAGVTVIPVIASPDPLLCNLLWLPEVQAKTDKEGRFRITGLPESGVRFDFLRPDLSSLRNQTLEDGGVIKMVAGGAVRGRVVDQAGKPVRDFRILVGIPRNPAPGEPVGHYFAGYEGIGVSFSSPDGTFVVSDLVAGNVHRISAVAEGYGQAEQDRVEALPITSLPPAESLTLTVGPPHRLTVRLVAAGGKTATPIADAPVVIVYGHRGLDERFNWGYDEASWNAVARQRTGPQGSVEVTSPLGEGTVLAQAAGYGRRRQGWRGGERELAITLEPECIVTGRATDAQGRPLAACNVRLECSSGDVFYAEVVPQDEGRFRFDGLPAGDYQLTIERDRQSLYRSGFSLKAGQTHQIAEPTVSRPGEGADLGADKF